MHSGNQQEMPKETVLEPVVMTETTTSCKTPTIETEPRSSVPNCTNSLTSLQLLLKLLRIYEAAKSKRRSGRASGLAGEVNSVGKDGLTIEAQVDVADIANSVKFYSRCMLEIGKKKTEVAKQVQEKVNADLQMFLDERGMLEVENSFRKVSEGV
ncbi:hypothetical protein NC652_028497 [Populus alba x Populus x berolinensis]|nr:hypothetical protein NC652_028497 [Populus alba x Populus x berolinensis]